MWEAHPSSRHTGGATLLRVPNAHRGKLILVVETHWSRGELVFWNNFSAERPAVLRVTWRQELEMEQVAPHGEGWRVRT